MCFEIKNVNGICEIYTPYNKDFIAEIKVSGGRWSATKKCWYVKEEMIDDVRKIMMKVYGRTDENPSETVDVILRFSEEYSEWKNSVILLGKTIASARGRDSGAVSGEEVVFLEGKPKSGGSVKNWYTVIPEGSVVKVFSVSKVLTDNADLPEEVTMEIINSSVDKTALLVEKEKLLARIAEIDKLLKD